MLIEYVGPSAAVTIASTGQQAVRGEPLEVVEEVAVRLCEQSTWQKVANDDEEE